MFRIGIDIGSSNAKMALLDEKGNILELLFAPTGFSSKDAYKGLLLKLNDKGYDIKNAKIVSTGYGRECVENADKRLTEITCHTLGAIKLFAKKNFILIDVGGQDTKIICVENARVSNFLMNDKCSAGTGRFLDIMAKIFDIDINSLCELARIGECSDVKISSLCTVFAESEVISLIGRSVSEEKIAYAIVCSIAEKVATQVGKLDRSTIDVFLTGGLCECEFFIETLSEILKIKIGTCPNARFAGSIGAALSI